MGEKFQNRISISFQSIGSRSAAIEVRRIGRNGDPWRRNGYPDWNSLPLSLRRLYFPLQMNINFQWTQKNIPRHEPRQGQLRSREREMVLSISRKFSFKILSLPATEVSLAEPRRGRIMFLEVPSLTGYDDGKSFHMRRPARRRAIRFANERMRMTRLECTSLLPWSIFLFHLLFRWIRLCSDILQSNELKILHKAKSLRAVTVQQQQQQRRWITGERVDIER